LEFGLSAHSYAVGSGLASLRGWAIRQAIRYVATYNAPMRYRLRTLLILLAVLPPLIGGAWWAYGRWQAERQKVIGVSINNWGRLRSPKFAITPEDQAAINNWIDTGPSSPREK
jgi:hypothetical protein